MYTIKFFLLGRFWYFLHVITGYPEFGGLGVGFKQLSSFRRLIWEFLNPTIVFCTIEHWADAIAFKYRSYLFLPSKESLLWNLTHIYWSINFVSKDKCDISRVLLSASCKTMRNYGPERILKEVINGLCWQEKKACNHLCLYTNICFKYLINFYKRYIFNIFHYLSHSLSNVSIPSQGNDLVWDAFIVHHAYLNFQNRKWL